MPKFPVIANERAFFEVMLNKDILRYLTNFHAKNIRAVFVKNRRKELLQNLIISTVFPARYDSNVELIWAMKTNNFTYFKFICINMPEFDVEMICNSIIIYFLHFRYLAFLRSKGYKIYIDEDTIYYVLAQQSNVDLLEFLYTKCHYWPSKKLLLLAVKMGYLDIVKWADNHGLLFSEDKLIEMAINTQRPEIKEYIESDRSDFIEDDPQELECIRHISSRGFSNDADFYL